MLVMQQTGNTTVNNFDQEGLLGKEAGGDTELRNTIKIKAQLQFFVMGCAASAEQIDFILIDIAYEVSVSI